jgi:ubiquinone/menaquinone biosynthesis C-methylase UbiE
MAPTDEFSFGDDSVATSYDDVLVPILFEPWAVALVDEHQPWAGKRILDLATGTGILAQLLAERAGPDGSVVGSDVNGEMLARAKARCEGSEYPVSFVEAPAESLSVPSESFDIVVCQQGFQFFSNKDDAAAEIHRVLRPAGTTVATTWRPVSECDFFGAICSALETVGESDISQMMRMPFDFFSEDNLVNHFEKAGFDNIQLTQRQSDLKIHGGTANAIRAAYSTPIGPMLTALPEDRQSKFRESLSERVRNLSDGGATIGQMASNVLTAEKSTTA